MSVKSEHLFWKGFEKWKYGPEQVSRVSKSGKGSGNGIGSGD